MKKKLLALLFVLVSLNFYAQINYEKSYFINNNGTKTECYIKNKNKNENPTNFEYKLNADESQVMIADIKTVKEFKIGDILKYERATVKLDTSNGNINVLNKNREPEFKEVTVFLKVLVDSETNLYEYNTLSLKQFFYKTSSTPIESLIYKKYIIEENSTSRVASNNDFQKQLFQNLNCGNKNIDDALKLKYTRKDLMKYFIDYNTCKNNTIVNYGKKLEKGSVNIKVLAGITSTSLSFSNSITSFDFDFDKKMNFTFGGELEWILPINRNKWSLFFAPSYNSYENSTTVTYTYVSGFYSETKTQKWEASFSYLDLPFGFRYYMFINDKSKIFIEGSYIISSVLNSDIHNDYNSQLKPEFANRMGLGIGYSFKNKFNVGLKYNSANILGNYAFYNSNNRLTSLVFGYTLFDNKKKK
jgi:hypothetical protein